MHESDDGLTRTRRLLVTFPVSPETAAADPGKAPAAMATNDNQRPNSPAPAKTAQSPARGGTDSDLPLPLRGKLAHALYGVFLFVLGLFVMAAIGGVLGALVGLVFVAGAAWIVHRRFSRGLTIVDAWP
jgi:hypothetical protein